MTTIRTRVGSEVVDGNRRQLLTAISMGIAAAGAFGRYPAAATESNATYQAQAATDEAIRPFSINVPEEDLAELRRRVRVTRWPDRKRSMTNPRASS